MSEKKTFESELPFEQAMQRLETIVTELEEGELSLDDMILRFEEGRALREQCEAKLNEVERKIEKLVEKDGRKTTEPFDVDAAKT